MTDLLFEIGTEEIPAGYLEPALEQMKAEFISKTSEMHIEHGDVRLFGTPRRLAFIVSALADKQDDIREELLGPSVKAGLDGDGNFTKAAMGFARSKGADVGDLKKVSTEKGEYLMLVREVKGEDVDSLLPGLLEGIIGKLSFPKSMRWATGSKTFARPLQWLLAMHGKKVIYITYEGIHSQGTSRGHRFLCNSEIAIEEATSYEQQLLEADVVVDIAKRREMTLTSIKEALADFDGLAGGSVSVDEELLDTVINLVEYPQGVCGSFDEKFLQLPDEVLITSMRVNQKYFPVVDTDGNLMAGFVAVNNTRMDDVTLTRKGHQRVLRARLEDALFFFNTDKERSLESFVEALPGIIFQAKLGTMQEKTERVVKLGRMLCEIVAPSLVADVERAAFLCKADLLTDMVGEFPSLQGIMGEAYALASGEKEGVALAIREHYMPRRAGAECPRSQLGAIVGLADRIDTLAGCFGIGQKPSGTADPFGLRRLSLAVLQIVQEFSFTLSLKEIFLKALALYGDRVDGSQKTVQVIVSFIEGRFRNDCVARGMESEVVLAATSVTFDEINDCCLRIAALTEMKKDDSFAILAASYKRIRNIIKENKETAVDPALFQDDAERGLYESLLQVRENMEPLLAKKSYGDAAMQLLAIKEPVDIFFDKVMVMAEDAGVRQNRLNLLTALGVLVLQIGDISKMQEG